MYTMNMTTEDAKYFMEAEEKAVNKIWETVKNYWLENAEVICAGMAAMSGRFYVPTSAK